MSTESGSARLEPIEGVLAVLDHGSMTGTNKHGLLLALLDVAPHVEPDNTVTGRRLAEVHLELHWDHARPFHDGILRQLTAPNRANTQTILTILDLRDSLPARIRDLSFERAHPHIESQMWDRAVDAVEAALWRNPVARLQNLPGDPPPFLYTRHTRPRRIRFLPGVADALTRHAAVLRPLIEYRFARFVAHTNHQLVGPSIEEQLHEHLFGEHRHMPPPALRNELIELQGGRCIYTDQPLTGLPRLPVDHVVPWSRQRLSVIENFAITTPTVNNAKTNLLLGPAMIQRWTRHLGTHADTLTVLADDHGWPTDPRRVIAVTRAMYRALPNGTGVWDGATGVMPLDRAARAHAIESLDAVT